MIYKPNAKRFSIQNCKFLTTLIQKRYRFVTRMYQFVRIFYRYDNDITVLVNSNTIALPICCESDAKSMQNSYKVENLKHS